MENQLNGNKMEQDQDSFNSSSSSSGSRRARRTIFEPDLYCGTYGVRRVYRRQNVMSQLDLPTVANLKNALYSCIVDALSENTETRRVAEEKISAMEIIEEFAIHLCDFAQNKDMNFAVRQMSSVLLKQYVDGHWSTTEENHVLHNFVLRNRIRKQLLEGLREPNSKIRNAFAYCVSYIGSLDFPEKWLTFFEDLHLLSVIDPEYAVHGVLRVYEDVIRDSDPQKVNVVAEPLLTELCYLLNDIDSYDVQVRISAVHVLCLYVNVCSSAQNQVRLALSTKLHPICKYFVEILPVEENSVNDYGLKTNIIRFFTLLVQKFVKNFGPILIMIMPTIWGMVMHYGDLYAKSVINNKTAWLDTEDDEGKVVGFTPLVLSLFDFIHCLVDSPKLNLMLFDVLTDIFYYIMIFMHITKNMEDTWLTEPFSFVEDDTNENFDTTIRVTARDVLMMICHDFDASIVVPHFSQAINRHIAELSFVAAEWKVHECIMFAIGCIKDIIIRASFADTLQFHFFDLTTTWQFALNHPELSLLLGRALWYSGKFSPLLTQTLFNNYMKSTLLYLKHSDTILRMFAIRTIIAHSEEFMNNPNKNLFATHLPTIAECLLCNLSDSQFIPYLFILSLSTLKIVLSLGTVFAESMEPRVTPLIINIFMKHHSDPDIVHEIRQIVKDYCLHTQVSTAVREKFTPILANILNSSDDKVPYGLQTVAMDLLQTLVKCSKPPLSEIMILIGFPAAINCILHTDDQLVMSSGGECLRSYLLIGAEQICNYTDSEGTSGLEYVLRAIAQLLDPAHSENACKRIGRLIITLINKAGPVLGSHMHFLLRAILSKMQRVEQMEVWQSLLIVFVYLFYTELEFVINFLTSVPGPTGASALEFVLIEWLNRESFFVGSYDRTVSVAALTKLLEYSVTSEDSRFDSIMVRDEYVTKVPRKESMWTQIPILGKAFKIICSETTYQVGRNAPPQNDNDSNTEDSDTDDDTASQVSDYRYYDTDPDQQDVLYAQDPVFSINILAHLTDFIQKFKTIPRFQWYVSLLNCKEKNTLASLGTF